MSRELAADTLVEIDKFSVRPFHIAQIDFASQSVYISEGPVITFQDNSFLEGALAVEMMDWDHRGIQKARIKLLDYSGSIISLVLGNKIADTPCTIWLTYGTSVDYKTPTKLITGSLVPVEINLDSVTLDVEQINVDSEFYPQEYCTKDNGFDHLPKNGTVIEWGDEKYELVSE